MINKMASVFRVITRIIPLTGGEDTFEPVPFSALTDDGISRDVKVLNITEPKSGISYRIERIEDVQTVGPKETVESLNQSFAEKLKGIPGFVQLKENDAHSNIYDKSFKFSLPQTISLKKNSTENEATNSLTISLVKNNNYKKISKLRISRKRSKIIGANDSEYSKKQASCPSPTFFKKKKKKSKLSSKNKVKSKLCQPLKIKIAKDPNNSTITSEEQETNAIADDLIENVSKEVVQSKDVAPEKIVEKVPIDELEDTESRELVIHEPDVTDSNSNSQQVAGSGINSSISHEVITFDSDFSSIARKIAEDANNCEDSNASNQTDRSSMSRRDSLENVIIDNIPSIFVVAEDNPLYDLLQPLKKYFVSGECLICGFIPTEIDYNAAIHMESHISSNSSFSFYKCICCNEKFYSPRNLYMHVLSREKTYSYMCDLCFLKFKRKHYLIRHNAKAHPSAKE